MALGELWSYVKGYVIITVKGPAGAPEDFMNAALARGIDLWGIRKVGERSLVARVYLRDVARIGRLLKQAGCAGRVETKVGFPFLLRRVLRRKGLVFGVALFSLALYALSSFVWFVDVSGSSKLEPESIAEFASRQGVRPGALKRSIDPNALSRRILAEFPGLAWVGVQLRGTMVSIEVVEKTLPETKRGVVNVVAAQDAIITNMIVLQGEPVASEGETVTRGETLIAGIVAGEQAGKPGEHAEVVSAKGIVLGRVWRSHTEAVPLVRQVETPTGRVRTARRVLAGGIEFVIGPRVAPFDEFVRQERSYQVAVSRIVELPIRVEETVYREVVRRVELVDRETALLAARERARAEVGARLPRGARIVDEREDVGYSHDRAVVYTYTVETIEDIAEERREERELERSTR